MGVKNWPEMSVFQNCSSTHKCIIFSFSQLALTHISPCKFPKSLERGYFGAKQGSRGVQKHFFGEEILDHLGCYIKWFKPIFNLL